MKRMESRAIKKYFNVWVLTAITASRIAFSSRFGAVIFISAKILRLFFFLFFILILFGRTKSIVGYSLWQIIFFYLTFNVIDNLAQFLLREVYRFRYYVLSGDFDYMLTKPFSPLFRALFGGTDILDLSTLFVSAVFIFVAISHLQHIVFINIIFYLLLIFNALLIAVAFHIFVLAIGVLTEEVDNTIMLYRDITQMGRLPVDVYQEPLRSLITFVIPVGIMMTFPSKALMGLLSFTFILLSFGLGFLLIVVSFKFWQFALRHYSSASS